MFTKAFRVKSNSQLKGSERKKFRSELLGSYSNLTEENLQDLLPNKEIITAMKIFTHTGESVMVYCIQKIAIVFEVEKVLYPTVYMLWKFPNLLYSFTTWPQVFPKITRGADLMLPGVVLKDGFHVKAFGKLEKGERVSVTLTNNKAPIAVGRAALSSMDMYMSAKRGKAVHILHFVGDELWGHGTKLSIPELGPPEGFENILENVDPEAVLDSSNDGHSPSLPEVSNMASALPDIGSLHFNVSSDVIATTDELDLPDCGIINRLPSMCTVATEDNDKPVNITDDSKDIMDELVEYCFLKALNTSAKKADYPMLSSKFFKLHMLSATPAGKSIDLKKSSYKKLSLFLGKMNSLEVIKVKEITKGVESIISVNSSHPLIRNFVDMEESPDVLDTSQMTEVEFQCRPEILEMYIITAAVLPFFSKFGLKKGTSLPPTIVRKHLTDYVKSEQLGDPNNRRMVKLDAVLYDILKSTCDAETLTWNDLTTKFLSCMTHSYQMSFSGKNPVLTKGKLEPIDIQVGKRTGNKKVTLINNLELYGVNLTDFARECQHGVAASTSISNIPGKKSAQLMVQGNQVLFVGNLLTGKYQIPKRYIRGLENAPKQKK